jgi:predicted metal-dependent peptidase
MSTRWELREVAAGLRMPMARAKAGSLMPYFSAGIQRLSPRPSPGLGTFGVTKRGHLLYDPELLAKMFVDEAATMMLHEYLHVYLDHAGRTEELMRKGVLDRGDADRELANNAADMEINDNLEEAGCIFPRAELFGLPPGSSSGVLAKDHGLPPHRTFEEYVIALVKKRQNSSPRPPQAGQGELPSCGSGSGGLPLPGEPDGGDADAQSSDEQRVNRKEDSQRVQAAQKSRGNVPSGIRVFADADLAPPKVPWERELQAEVGRALRHKSGMADYTYTLRARHQAALDLAFGEESPVLPGMWAPLAEVALVVDTSGSMMGDALEVCVREAHGILRTMGGARVTLVACDAAVHAVKPVKDVKELRANLLGGGGTDFTPAFKALEELPRGRRPDVVVFATDGYGSYPDQAPKWKHVWLVVPGGHIGVEWGKVEVES